MTARNPQQATAAPASRFADLPHALVGGMRMIALDRQQTAELMVQVALERRGQVGRPYVMSSANGEVISRCANEPRVAAMFAEADLLNADGQPLVWASRLFCKTPLPERVATTDLFHDVAKIAVRQGITCYLYGATDDENAAAVARAEAMHPGLAVVGRSHGFHQGAALDTKIAEINGLKPDILWLALGVPREQEFCRAFADQLTGVGLIKAPVNARRTGCRNTASNGSTASKKNHAACSGATPSPTRMLCCCWRGAQANNASNINRYFWLPGRIAAKAATRIRAIFSKGKGPGCG
jgi:N-acetylglucosaminyldiphosphoundecaprenol N-acetyl-beta-D-mannosaminyltransferase